MNWICYNPHRDKVLALLGLNIFMGTGIVALCCLYLFGSHFSF